MTELTDHEALAIAKQYLAQRFTEEDARRIVAILVKCDLAGMIKYAYQQGQEQDIELIRDTYNRGYEKGKRDEIQVVAQAQADQDRYDWKEEIKKGW